VLVSSNGLLAQLGSADQAWVQQRAELIQMKPGDVLASQDAKTAKIYFPVSGSIALFIPRNDKAVDTGFAIGLIGAEGAVGLQAALGLGAGHFQFLVQSAGQAYVLDGMVAERWLKRRQQILLLFSRYLWSMYEDMASLASQANAQDIKMRFAYWLLLSADRCAPDALQLTHAHIAKMLGVRRSSISIAARELKVMRYIHYSRGHIALTNLTALQALAQIH
jgi:CRP-like cAMP-binding protein